LRDLEEGPKRGLVWRVDQAKDAIGFFRDVLCLNGGDFEGDPFILLDFQEFIVGSLFGWYDEDGTRRFRVAYIETGKGSGKSPLAAGVGLKGLVADGEKRAEIYAAATKKDQAMILFRDAVAMVDLSPVLAERIRRAGSVGHEWNLAYQETMSYFRPISSDDGQSGPRPHMALLDEIHEHRDGRVIEMLRAGTKGRKQAMIFMITNSGANKQSVCYEYHEYAGQVCAGMVEDDTFFGYVCALDEGDDPFNDEKCWLKANPSLGITIQKKYLREQVREARGMPSKESVVRRLNFCQWVEANSPAISYDHWIAAQDKEFVSNFKGRRCYAGLDLSSTTDLTSLVLSFEPTEDDPYWRYQPFFWLPEEGMAEREKRDKVPYSKWLRDGHLEVTPGRAVSKQFVLQRLVQLFQPLTIEALAYDRWRIEDLKVMAEEGGLTLPEMHAFGQGYQSMGPAYDEFELRLLNDLFRHPGNPVFTWNAANTVVTTDPAGSRKPAKDKAIGRIDGIVAAVMATGVSMKRTEQKASVYEERGLV
tara:strand:+ start:14592 stop:16187 length:1596 start_codon:yes stop_codon:yes gene_type:complete